MSSLIQICLDLSDNKEYSLIIWSCKPDGNRQANTPTFFLAILCAVIQICLDLSDRKEYSLIIWSGKPDGSRQANSFFWLFFVRSFPSPHSCLRYALVGPPIVSKFLKMAHHKVHLHMMHLHLYFSTSILFLWTRVSTFMG